MRKIRIGINGFGRIGRAVFRNCLNNHAVEIVAINDPKLDADSAAYAVNYDSVYQRMHREYGAGDNIIFDGDSHSVRVCKESAIDRVPWGTVAADYVIDSSGTAEGLLKSRNLINRGEIKKVFTTHSPEDVDFTLVLGANEDAFNVTKHHLISTSICDATALAPVLKLIQLEFGIAFGYVTTVHPFLNYQNLLDGNISSQFNPQSKDDAYVMGRSSVGNIMPKSTTALKATAQALRHVDIDIDMIGSFSYRVPTQVVGSADISLVLEKSTSKTEIRSIFTTFEERQRWKLLSNSKEPLVSLDFIKSPYSATIDHRWTDVVADRMMKLVIWYDNEWGYANRVLDGLLFVHEQLRKHESNQP